MKQQTQPAPLVPVVVDTREQLPFFIHPIYDAKITKTVKGLKTGDYSLVGFEDKIAIERKSIKDLYGSLTHGRKRFEAEFERFRDYEFSAVVVEASTHQILHPAQHDRYWRSKTNPASIFQSILSWTVRYPTKWILTKDRLEAEATTYHLLRHYWNAKQPVQQTFEI